MAAHLETTSFPNRTKRVNPDDIRSEKQASDFLRDVTLKVSRSPATAGRPVRPVVEQGTRWPRHEK